NHRQHDYESCALPLSYAALGPVRAAPGYRPPRALALSLRRRTRCLAMATRFRLFIRAAFYLRGALRSQPTGLLGCTACAGMVKGPDGGARVSLRFRVLGPLEVVVDGKAVPVGGARAAAILSLLLVEPGAIVSRDRLIDEVWADDPPVTAVTALQVHISG